MPCAGVKRRVNRPNFFIIGAPKCGTTAMAHYLSGHPEVFMARKEMHGFGADLRFGARFYRRDPEDYLSEFNGWDGQPRAGEASVWYLYSQQAASEIHSFNPDSRIIVMLREPTEMLYSLYYQFRCDANEHLPSFERALEAEEERRLGRGVRRKTYFVQGLIYRETVRYAEQMRRFFDTFGRERVHVVLYDDFASNPGNVLRRTLDFLEVKPVSFENKFRVINGNKFVRSCLLRSVLTEPLVRSTVLAMRPWLPAPVFNALGRAEALVWRCNTRFARRPPLDPELRAKLKREFAPEVERLSRLLGRDLTHWST